MSADFYYDNVQHLQIRLLTAAESRDATHVSSKLEAIHDAMFAKENSKELTRIVCDVMNLFCAPGRGYQPSDLVYHGIDHTFHAAVCMAQLLYKRHLLKIQPILTRQKFLIGMAAVLLHDFGFLRDEHDAFGTGAKYMSARGMRSKQFARKYLESKLWNDLDIRSVEILIDCTIQTTSIAKISFLDASDEALGCAICTADYLGQMSDPQYIEKLHALYKEFEEFANFMGIEPDKRLYRSAEDLIVRTPGFWRYVLNDKLISDAQSVYKHLADPYPDGKNIYLDAIEANVQKTHYTLRANTR